MGTGSYSLQGRIPYVLFCFDIRQYHFFIGLATASDPLGPWEDQGEVVKTNATLAQHNAIDANIAFDRSGEQWFVYGSFFGGIYIAPLNKETGKLQEKSYGQRIAFRPKTVDTAIEGPFIYYHPETDYYYLFVSFDSLNDSYNIRVLEQKKLQGHIWTGMVRP